MPAEYEEIKKSLIDSGKSEEEAKRIASKTFISRGETEADRSKRAKQLQHDKKHHKSKD